MPMLRGSNCRASAMNGNDAVRCSRLAQYWKPISGKPEIGGRAPQDEGGARADVGWWARFALPTLQRCGLGEQSSHLNKIVSSKAKRAFSAARPDQYHIPDLFN